MTEIDFNPPKNENIFYNNYFHCFVCKDCHQIPIIILLDLDNSEVKCNCLNGQILSLNNVMKKYIDDIEKFSQYFYCKFHENINTEKNFEVTNDDIIIRYNCKKCKEYMCQQCSFNHKCELSNLNNNLIDLKVNENKINDIINKLQNLLNPNDKNKTELILDDNLDKWNVIISSIIQEYKHFPHFNLADNIINIYLFLTKLSEEDKKKNDINKGIEINDVNNYITACENDSVMFAKKIKINKKDLNILIFEEDIQNLNSLEVLDIQNNFIKDISVLTKGVFNNLKRLLININRLGDDQINNIENLNSKNLVELNLGTNLFRDYKIFQIISNFPKLESLDLSSNRLEIDSIDLSNKIFGYDSIKALNLSNGIFSDETINLISVLRFKNLEFLDLSSNNLNSISFLTKLNFGKNPNKIKKLLLNYNNISLCEEDEENLGNIFNNLEILELKDNCTARNKIQNSKFKIITFDYEDDICLHNKFIDCLKNDENMKNSDFEELKQLINNIE